MGDVGPTQGRHTSVVFGNYGFLLQEPFFDDTRKGGEIGGGNPANADDMEMVPGIGWRPESNLVKSQIRSKTWVEDGTLNDAQATTSSLIAYVVTGKKRTGTGITSTPLVASQSGAGWLKRVGSGQNWNTALTEEEHTPVETEYDGWYLSYVWKSNQSYDPNTGVSVSFIFPGGSFSGPAARFYFSGPRGNDGLGFDGLGRYRVSIYPLGKIVLHELIDMLEGIKFWKKRDEWIAGVLDSKLINIAVMSDAVFNTAKGGWFGSRLVFLVNPGTMANPVGNRLIESVTGLAQDAIRGGVGVQKPHVYNIPRNGPQSAASAGTLQIDLREDVRAFWQVMVARYRTSGSITDEPFDLGFYPTADSAAPLYVTLDCDMPAGTTFTPRLFRVDTGDEITGTATSNPLKWKFEVPELDEFGPVHQYYVRIDYTGTETVFGTLRSRRVHRPALYQIDDLPEPLEVKDDRATGDKKVPTVFVSGTTSISGETENPASGTARVTISNLTATGDDLRLRVGGMAEIRTNWTEEGDAKFSVLHRGILAGNTWRRINPRSDLLADASKQYPKLGAYEVDFDIGSEWRRLTRVPLPARLELASANDLAANVIPEVTDAMKRICAILGFGANNVNIPSRPIPLYDWEQMVLEPGTLAGELLVEMAQEYLGAHLVTDPNAAVDGVTDYGTVIRLIERKTPPYRNLARFYINHPGAGKLLHAPGSYPDVTISGFEDQPVACTFIEAGDEIRTEPAEANSVFVQGGAGLRGRISQDIEPNGATSSNSETILTAFAFNPTSYNPFNLAPDHEHYPFQSADSLDELVQVQVFDTSLTTQRAVNWVCRRVFDQCAFAREFHTFEAPLLLVTDTSDTMQIRPRKLRLGDPVQIQQPDGSFRQYLVSRVDPSYEKDHVQFARYECVTQTNIDRFGQPYSMYDLFSLTRDRVRQLKRAFGHPARQKTNRRRSRELSIVQGGVLGFPSPGIKWDPIQYIDPDDPLFGQFKFMPDYDPLP